jgi:tetratricopeptide (TPR) repeat protein
VRSNLDRELTEAPELVAELLALPAERREEELQREARFHSWGVCELLLTRSAGETDPAESGRLGRLALAGADCLDPARHPFSVVEDLKARAWAAVGDALRDQRDLERAEEALRAAAACLARGTGDLLVEARLLEFEASLRRRQGRIGEAAALLKMAAARYRETGEEQLLERALAERSSILRQEGVLADPPAG